MDLSWKRLITHTARRLITIEAYYVKNCSISSELGHKRSCSYSPWHIKCPCWKELNQMDVPCG